MMNWSRQNSFALERRGSRRWFVFFTLSVILIGVVDLFSDGFLRSHARAYLMPVIDGTNRVVNLATAGTTWSTRRALVSENTELKSRVARLEERDALFQALKEQHEALSSLVRLAGIEQGITAPITSSFRASPYGTFSIGVGRSQGIAPGSTVLSAEGFVLGSVIDAKENSSLVRMVFAPQEVTEVVVGANTFSVRGRGMGNARAQVSREASLKTGDVVLAPTYSSRPVGTIGTIEFASSSAFMDVFVHVPINLNTLRYVFVIPAR